jgi:uncharacterized protein YbaP (TraB family)
MTLTRLFKRLGAAIAAAASLIMPVAGVVSAQTAAPARHMLFRVHGKDGPNVYLLGSVHLLSPDASKLPAEVDSAFEKAKTVAFETSIDSVQMRGQELLVKARYEPGMSLKRSLSPAGVAKADSVLKLYGLSIDQVDAFKPWFVSLMLTQMAMMKANFQSQYGVDIQLNERAKAEHKPVVGLESVDFQLNLFDTIGPEDQERMITSLKGPAESAKEFENIKTAWMSGDVTKLEALFKEQQDDSPKMLDVMLNNRNASWIPKIDAMLKGKDDALVVVGAAHLIGAKGVLQLLRAQGYTVEQL